MKYFPLSKVIKVSQSQIRTFCSKMAYLSWNKIESLYHGLQSTRDLGPCFLSDFVSSSPPYTLVLAHPWHIPTSGLLDLLFPLPGTQEIPQSMLSFHSGLHSDFTLSKNPSLLTQHLPSLLSAPSTTLVYFF